MPDETIFECPICESHVTSTATPTDPEATLLCGTCGQTFSTGQARVVDHFPVMIATSAKKKEDPLPPPAPPKATGAGNKHRGPTKTAKNLQANVALTPSSSAGATDPSATAAPDATLTPTPVAATKANVSLEHDWSSRLAKESLLRRAAQRKRSSQRIFWCVFVVSLLGILGGAAYFYWPKIQAAGWWSTANFDSTHSSSTNDNSVANSDSDSKPVAIEDQAPLRFGKLSYRSQSEAEAVWNKISPTLFELSIKRNGTTERSVGVLVDSRGWLVTTLSSISDADEVQCRNVPNQPTLRGNTQGLLDNARGILAEDQQHDLAIIQINRAQVNALSGPEVAKTIPVAGSYVWSVTVPGPDQVAWIAESHVTFDSMSRDHTPTMKKELAASGLSELPSWLILDSPSPLAAGTAFFSASGELLGLATKNSKRQHALVAFPEQISLLLQRVDKESKPFRSSVTSPDTAVPNPDTSPVKDPKETVKPDSVASTIPLVEEDSLIRSESQELNEQAQACAAFSWVPANPEQFEQLYRMMTSFGVAATQIKEREIRLRDLEVLREQIKYWRAQGSILFSNVPERVFKQVNELGDWNVGDRPSAPNLAFIEMSYPANLGNETHVAKVIGTEVYLSFEADPERFIMERNSIWLVAIVEIDRQLLEIKVHERDETKVMARKVKMAHAERLTQ